MTKEQLIEAYRGWILASANADSVEMKNYFFSKAQEVSKLIDAM